MHRFPHTIQMQNRLLDHILLMEASHTSNQNSADGTQQQLSVPISSEANLASANQALQIREYLAAGEAQALSIDDCGAKYFSSNIERESRTVGWDFVLGSIFAGYAIQLDPDIGGDSASGFIAPSRESSDRESEGGDSHKSELHLGGLLE